MCSFCRATRQRPPLLVNNFAVLRKYFCREFLERHSLLQINLLARFDYHVEKHIGYSYCHGLNHSRQNPFLQLATTNTSLQLGKKLLTIDGIFRPTKFPLI